MTVTETVPIAVSQDDTPQESWTVQQLGEYCRRTTRRVAAYAWRIGRALNLAKAQLEHGAWAEWLATYCPGYSHSTVHRYMRVAKRFREADLEALALTDAYRLLGISSRGRPKSPAQPDSPGPAQGTLHRLSRPPEDTGGDLREVPEEDRPGPEAGFSAKESPQEVKPEPAPGGEGDGGDARETLLGEMGDDLPGQIRDLRDLVASILDADEGARESCWQQVDRDAVAEEIAGLRGALDRLEADLHARV